jgi:hypothetical protein
MSPGERENGAAEEHVRFHYSREERLKKLKPQAPRPIRPWRRKRRRGIVIILVDLILVALVFYFFNRPVNLYLEKPGGDLQYQLNVSTIKGKKVLIGLTCKNPGDEEVELSEHPVVLEIRRGEEEPLVSRTRSFRSTLLARNESESVVFLIDDQVLPRRGRVLIFYGPREGGEALFDEQVRF